MSPATCIGLFSKRAICVHNKTKILVGITLKYRKDLAFFIFQDLAPISYVLILLAQCT